MSKEKMVGVYFLWAPLNDQKYYVGSSIDLKTRLNWHKSYLKRNKHYNKKLQNYYNKYGPDSIKTCIFLTNNNLSSTELRVIEKQCIEEFNAVKTGFNISSETAFFEKTPDGLKRLSEKTKQRQSSKEYKEKLSIKYSGTKSNCAKLTKQNIKYIKLKAKKRSKAGLGNISILAKKFKVHRKTIMRVVNNQTYKRD